MLGPPERSAGVLGGLCSLLLQQRCFPLGVGGVGASSTPPACDGGPRQAASPSLSMWLTPGCAIPSAQCAWSCGSSLGHLPTSRSPSLRLFPRAAKPRGSVQAQQEDRSEETGGKRTPLNVMEATAWFCQPLLPLPPSSPHPACLLLFFSLSLGIRCHKD